MICVMTYEGEQRHQMAREFVALLRGKDYRQPAYIFNHGREERIQEDQRIKKYVEEKRRELKALGITDPGYKIPIRRIPVKETTAVLIGGYRDMATARRSLDDIKGLKSPDPRVVKLDQGCIAAMDPKNGQLTGDQKWVPVNPFPRSFIVRNPTLPHQSRQDSSLDVATLRPLNASESFSLLNCPKKVTLAIAEYRVPATFIKSAMTMQMTSAQVGTRHSSSNVDYAVVNAHNLAEYFHKMGIEAYVLHTPMSSIVSIGSFDSARDQRMRTMQARYNELMERFPALQQEKLKLFPNAWPMQVPH
jgi:hypothetical protein